MIPADNITAEALLECGFVVNGNRLQRGRLITWMVNSQDHDGVHLIMVEREDGVWEPIPKPIRPRTIAQLQKFLEYVDSLNAAT
jgi:hypothetical protein